MIQEAYVSYEVAKLLKEKGFDISTFCYYSEQDKHFDYPDDMIAYNWNSHFKDCVSAPTQQMAMRWLREQGKVIEIHVVHHPEIKADISFEYRYFVYDHFQKYKQWPLVYFEYYEECVEAAIKYCLEKLIR